MQPDIVLITTDQHRADYLGCTGTPGHVSPAIDALAAGGTVFERAYCSAGICAPSRCSLLTGQFPHAHGVISNGRALPLTAHTIADRLTAAGYETVLFGKAHFQPELTGEPGSERRDPQPRAFPWYGFRHALITEDVRAGPYESYVRALGYEERAEPDSAMPGRQMELRPSIFAPEHHQTRWITDRALEWLESAAQKPRFTWISYVHPHHPFVVPEPYFSMFDPRSMPGRDYVEGELDDPHLPELVRGFFDGSAGGHRAARLSAFDDAAFRAIQAVYCGMIRFVDDQVGRILDQLRRSGRTDRTIVVFTADHGEYMGAHGLLFKGFHHDPVIRVPCVVAGPGIPSGHRSGRVIQALDLIRTVLERAGAAIDGIAGRSLDPLLVALTGEGEGAWDDTALIVDERWHSIIHGSHRLTVVRGRAAGLLHDRSVDRCERRNLWDAGDHLELREALRALLTARLVEASGPVRPRIAAF
jgi:arylsulfatase